MRSKVLSITQSKALRIVCLAMALLIIALIFGMADSSLATGSLNFQPPFDKLLHIGVYGILAALLWFAGTIRSRIGLWLLVVGIGLLDELQQRGIAGRQSSLIDFLADMVGVTLGLLLAGWILSRVLVLHNR
jgi:VanZ family protein